MPFKIVQTVENGELCLCVVPSQWEKKGMLHWPKKSAVTRLCQDENSCPNPNWEKLNCVLKREFSSYAKAQHELERMESFPDTETDEQNVVQPETKKVRYDQKVRQSVVKDFNKFLTNPKNDQDDISAQEESSNTGDLVIELEDSSNIIVYEQDVLTNTIVDGIQATITGGNLPDAAMDNLQVPELYDIVPEASLETIVANQIVIHNNQLKTMACFAKLATAIEILTKSVISIENSAQPGTRAETTDVAFKPVSSIEEMDRLEAELNTETNMLRYVEKLSAICGTTGKADGIDSAYRLIDCLVTREMINMCSWTGQARDTGEPTGNFPDVTIDPNASTSKIPLKFYKKFRELFFRVIRLADQDFSVSSSEKFLKGVMKNSKQRLTSKVTSTHKNRPKNLKYGPKKIDSINIPIE